MSFQATPESDTTTGPSEVNAVADLSRYEHMAVGSQTSSVSRRYDIVDAGDLDDAAEQLDAAASIERGPHKAR